MRIANDKGAAPFEKLMRLTGEPAVDAATKALLQHLRRGCRR
jgi:hypothetical protein